MVFKPHVGSRDATSVFENPTWVALNPTWVFENPTLVPGDPGVVRRDATVRSGRPTLAMTKATVASGERALEEKRGGQCRTARTFGLITFTTNVWRVTDPAKSVTSSVTVYVPVRSKTFSRFWPFFGPISFGSVQRY